jgi:hypothetical protein
VPDLPDAAVERMPAGLPGTQTGLPRHGRLLLAAAEAMAG